MRHNDFRISTASVLDLTYTYVNMAGSGLLSLLFFVLYPVTDMSTTLAQIGVKFCMIIYIVFCSFEGGAPMESPNAKFSA